MNKQELQGRLKSFAHRCVKLTAALPQAVLGKYLQGQLIRSSLSAAANYRAACIAQSRAAFVAKISIVFEELDETCFWLEFIIEEKLFARSKIEPLLKEAGELASIFASARKTSIQRGKKM